MLMLIVKSEMGSYRNENFNTSHVNVNLSSAKQFHSGSMNFNTSHVNVNQLCADNASDAYFHFNTSHVNVNLFV